MAGGRHRPAWRFLPPLHLIVAETAPLTLTTEPVGVLEAPRAPGRVLVTTSDQTRLSGRVKGIVAAAPVAHDLVDLPLRRAATRRAAPQAGAEFTDFTEYSAEDAFETIEVVAAGSAPELPAPELPEVVTPADLVTQQDSPAQEDSAPVVHVRRAAPSSAPLLTVAQVQPPQVAQEPPTPSRFMHITYREQDQQLAEWYAEQNQAEQPAPNIRPAEVVVAPEPVGADAAESPFDSPPFEPPPFEPVAQEREFTPPTPGVKRRGRKPAVMRRASLAESRRQGLGIKRRPAQAAGDAEQVIIDAPVVAALPAAQAVPDDGGLDSPETTVEETAPSPPSVKSSRPPSPPPVSTVSPVSTAVVAEDAVAVREVPAAEPERLLAPSATAPAVAPPATPPPDVSVDRPLQTPVEPDLPLRQAGSPQVRPAPETTAPEAAQTRPQRPPTDASRPDVVAVPDVVHRETAPREPETLPSTGPVRPQLPLPEKSAPAKPAAPRAPIASETARQEPELPLRDRSSRQAGIRDESGAQETADVLAPREVTPSEPVRHEPAQAEPVRLENATYEPAPGPDSPQATVDAPATRAVTAEHAEPSEPDEAQPLVLRNPAASHPTPPRPATPQPHAPQSAAPPSAAAPHAPQSAPPQPHAPQSAAPRPAAPRPAAPQSAAPRPLAPQSAAPKPAAQRPAAPRPSAPDAPQSTAPQPPAPQSAASRLPAPRPVAPRPHAPQSAAPQSAAPQSAAPQSAAPQSAGPQPAAPQPAAPHATAPEPSAAPEPPAAPEPLVVPVHAPSAVSPQVPELELSSTPQLAPVALSVVGHMISSAIEERVPPALIGPLRRALAMDLAEVPIRRGEAVSATAERLGARAFTADGAVYLPDEAGSVDSTGTAPLLAHELTHAAQQEHFGVTMPGLETVTGQHLESEAVAMEEWVRDGAVGPPPVMYGNAEPETEHFADSDVVEHAQAAPRLSVSSGRRTPTSTELALERFRQSRPEAAAPSTDRPVATPAALLERMRRQNPNSPPPGTDLPVATPAALLDRLRRQNPSVPPPSTDRPNATPAGLLDRLRRPNPSMPPPGTDLPVATPAALLDRMRRQNPSMPPPSTDLPLATPAALFDRMRRQGATGPPAAPEAATAAMITAMDQLTGSVPAGPPPGPGFVPAEPPDEPPEDLVTYGPDRPPPGWSPGGDLGEPAPSSVLGAPPDLAEFVREVRDNPPRRWLDLDDPDHFDEISHRVYNTLQARFRFDVLLERERNGTLMDFS